MQVSTAIPNLATAKKLGLNEEEFEKIQEILGRLPNFTELSIYAVMWSEHCSYKNSITQLKTLPTEGENLLVAAGEENAGLVDLGNGLGCAFKIESHNHPSAIEPYQGAATGVGGIHRDIFTMGARPIAALNSLRFGNIDSDRTKKLVKGVVRGIGDYGNCLGVPTIGGETYFHDCYNQNILVNAFSLGLVDKDLTASAVADGPGNPVFIVGSATGRDGIHGATFASGDLTENSSEDLPAVQVGDPFQEKLLLEATLEAIKTGALVGVQDMGAAGITCSTSEMSAKSGTGMDIDLDKIPTRQANMEAFEILLSESQERMLMVCHKGREQELFDVFDKWDLNCAEIGIVTDTGRLRYFQNGELIANVPGETLVLGGGAPVYERSYKRPSYFDQIEAYSLDDIGIPADLKKVAENMASFPNIASKRWIYEQYDHTVRTNNLGTKRSLPTPVIRVKDTDYGIAMSVDCNSSYVYADPYKGTMIAVSEAARNIVCSGGKPMAITNCLNFGNPYNEEVYYQFVHAIKGMGDACRKYRTPVTGGNVSFYNQTEVKNETIPVYPTPTIGMIGIVDDLERLPQIGFENEGDLIYMIGESRNDISSSEYVQNIHGIQHSPAPHFELEEEYNLHESISKLLRSGIVLSIQDVSQGGLFFTLLECAAVNEKGFAIEAAINIREDAYLFGEAQSRIVVSISPDDREKLKSLMTDLSQEYALIGSVKECEIDVWGEPYGEITHWKDIIENSISQKLEK